MVDSRKMPDDSTRMGKSKKHLKRNIDIPSVFEVFGRDNAHSAKNAEASNLLFFPIDTDRQIKDTSKLALKWANE